MQIQCDICNSRFTDILDSNIFQEKLINKAILEYGWQFSENGTYCAECIPRATPSWSRGTLVGIDFETTGIDVLNDLPVSVAISTYHNRKMIFSRYFIINPGVPIPPQSTAIHNITDREAVENGVPLNAAVDEIYTYIQNASQKGWPICGMNISYDLQLFDNVLSKITNHSLQELPLYAIDTLVLDRHFDKYRPGPRNLSALAEHYKVSPDTSGEDFHNASYDVAVSMEIIFAEADTYLELLNTSLDELTASQELWHKEWANNYDHYLKTHDKEGLSLSSFVWPV